MKGKFDGWGEIGMKTNESPEIVLPLSVKAVADLLSWYDSEKRDLPWRHTLDPYRIWISEIMLQQTRVEAVKPYYARFLSELPDIRSLAGVSEERLLKLWEGLGYYSRARNLQKAAKVLVSDHGGKMPADYDALLSLPGIGEYTAGAVASIAFGIRVPAVDGNVLRVLARLLDSDRDVTDPALKSEWRQALLPVIPARAGDFNQSLIELGATLCGPNQAALCASCPLRTVCGAFASGRADLLPIRAPKKPRRIEELTVLVIRDDERTALHRRPPRGLLAGLYELPNLPGHLSPEELPGVIRSLGFEPLQIKRLEDSKHLFTHIEWRMSAYSVRISPAFDGFHGASGFELIPDDRLRAEFAVPSAFGAYTKYLF